MSNVITLGTWPSLTWQNTMRSQCRFNTVRPPVAGERLNFPHSDQRRITTSDLRADISVESEIYSRLIGDEELVSTGAMEEERIASDITAFLEPIMHHLRMNRVDEADELIYDKIDDLLGVPDHSRCDELIKQLALRITQLPPALTRLILCLTIKDKPFLQHRAIFWRLTYEELTHTYSSEIANRLIGHLK